jgi:phage-related protein
MLTIQVLPMPTTTIYFFRDEDGTVPFVDWLAELEKRNHKAFEKCLYMLDLLRQTGHELRRPHADLLRNGVYELRTRVGRVNYRILYGFVGKNLVLVSHGITKESSVPDAEIDRAIARLALYQRDPKRYVSEEEIENAD